MTLKNIKRTTGYDVKTLWMRAVWNTTDHIYVTLSLTEKKVSGELYQRCHQLQKFQTKRLNVHEDLSPRKSALCRHTEGL